MTGAEIAAVVLGAIGAVGGVAGVLALWQNRELSARSDAIQERLAAVEEARRRDELQPELTMSADQEASLVVLTIRNGDRTDLDHVEIVEAIEAPPVISRGIVDVVGPYYSVKMGQAMTVTVTEDRESGGLLVLSVRVTSGAESWMLALSCEVPGYTNAYGEPSV